MAITVGVIMDAIEKINTRKDSTFAMLLEAQRRNWQVCYMNQQDLYQQGERVYGSVRDIRVEDNTSDWFTLGPARITALDKLDVILMRKDPPFNMEYIYTTYLLERAEQHGTLIVNRPQALRDANEKLAATWFPELSPQTIVTRRIAVFTEFLNRQHDIIVKPLDGMGGESIFHIRSGDLNTNVILETLTQHQTRTAMAQAYIPEIVHGDKRILIVDGEVIPYALARIPTEGELRGNLAAGGSGVAQTLSARDLEIANTVAPELRRRGILFAGIDVIGEYLTEVNVTSPTCIRELDAHFDLNIAGTLMDSLEKRLNRNISD